VTGEAVVDTVGVAGAAVMSETDTLTKVETWPSEFEVMLVSVEVYVMSPVAVNWSLNETGSTTLPGSVWKNPLSLEAQQLFSASSTASPLQHQDLESRLQSMMSSGVEALSPVANQIVTSEQMKMGLTVSAQICAEFVVPLLGCT
jgi:hypothetical protein